MKNLINTVLLAVAATRQASYTDINGTKSTGKRDGNKVDFWASSR